jgi:uncharacterized OsmC-like protein
VAGALSESVKEDGLQVLFGMTELPNPGLRPGRRRQHLGIAPSLARVVEERRPICFEERHAMEITDLKSIQAPLKARYREEPQAALVTLRAAGSIGEGVTCSVETGRAIARAGLHPASGGSGANLCSGDMLLEALVACAGVTLNAVATSLGLPVRDARITAEGDLDFRGTLGVAKDAPVGFREIRLSFAVEGELSGDQLATLLKLTERYCVVLQTLKQSPAISVTSRIR